MKKYNLPFVPKFILKIFPQLVNHIEYNMGSVAQKFWTNDVIWRKIAGYLNISDLKELSCVNKDFLEKVRSISRFNSAAGQNVSGEMEIHTFFLLRAIVTVNTLNPSILQEVASTTFQETEYLKLQGFEKLSDIELNSRLIKIVSGCPKLKSLTFESLDFFKHDFGPFLKNDDVNSILANLEEMQIGKAERKYLANTLIVEEITNVAALLEAYDYFSNFSTKLVKFVYTEPPILMSPMHVMRLLDRCSHTLQELKLTVDFEGSHFLKQIKFPKLVKLDLAVLDFGDIVVPQPGYELEIENFLNDVIPFVKNHLSNLSELVFSSNHQFCLIRFCELLRQPKYSKNIQVLRFHTLSGFTESFPSINWDFLKAMPNLRGFDLDIIFGRDLYPLEEIGKSLYYSLPSTIQSLELCAYEIDCSLEKMMDEKSSVLLGFTNLTALDIQCKSFLNDESLQFICKHLTKLRSFKGNFTRVTSLGISGVDSNRNINTGVSIANLKGLTELEIDFDERMSLDDVLNASRFSFLEKLAIEWPDKIDDSEWDCPPEKLWRLLRQNPCLEFIQIWVRPPVVDIREKVRQLYPRFKWGWPTECPEIIYSNTGRFKRF